MHPRPTFAAACRTPSTAVDTRVSGHPGRMEQWEHAVIRALNSGPAPEFVVDHKLRDLVGNQQPSWDNTVALLNSLGGDGWQLVSADDVGADGRTGT